MGGHVIFSHYDYFDQLLDAAVGTGEFPTSPPVYILPCIYRIMPAVHRPRTLERTRARVLRVDDEALGPLPLPEQHLLSAAGGPDQLHQRPDRGQGESDVMATIAPD